ncbi:MAG TPA: glycosyltransferase family 1 protein [Terriglobales bacterium]|nr:glycosyltransferase family 1 protein [Terriglobales bacterium]
MRIFLNGLAASAGAGLTYLRNVVPQLAKTRDAHTTLAVQPDLRKEFECLPQIEVFSPPNLANAARRFWYEQRQLPSILRKCDADILLSAGNFALRRSPVPQILLSGNSLYTSGEFRRDLVTRRKYGMLLDTAIKGVVAKKSVQWAERTVAPSQAFADDLMRWTGKDVAVVHHGFDSQTFFPEESLPSPEIENALQRSSHCLRLLFVSHYNYYRNFETLLRAVPLLQQQSPNRKIKLLLTCKLEQNSNPGAYDVSFARRLVRELGISESVEEIGPVRYDCLHHLYRACDIYLTAAYAETFAHPLVEAMASNLPIVASDLRVHREVCGDAAVYFPAFDSNKLAERILEVASSSSLRSQLAQASARRANNFSWSQHVCKILNLAEDICRRTQPSNPRPALVA